SGKRSVVRRRLSPMVSPRSGTSLVPCAYERRLMRPRYHRARGGPVGGEPGQSTVRHGSGARPARIAATTASHAGGGSGCARAPAAATTAAPAAAPASADVATRRKALDALLAEQWEYRLKSGPEMASVLGDDRYNDRWSDLSIEATQRDLAKTQEFLTRFQAI